MELISYLTQIIVSVGIFAILCFIGEQLKKILPKYLHLMDPHEYFPKEEILTLKQVLYLILILGIYLCIINFFFDRFFDVSQDLFLINSLIDIIISIIIVVGFYKGSTKSRIIFIFLMPLTSISAIVFGSTLLGYWDFIRIPTLLFMVIYLYHKFLEFTDENQLGKLILILISIVFTCLVLTILLENQTPINALGMVSNAFTSNGYAVLGQSIPGKLNSLFLVWGGYVISGVATASLTASILIKHFNKRVEELERIIEEGSDE